MIKKLLLIILLLATNGTYAYDLGSNNTKFASPSYTKDTWAFTNEITRLGNQAQKFEIGHGQCGSNKGYSDCENGAQRIERQSTITHLPTKEPGAPVYYAYSLFLPSDWDYHKAGSKVTLGQVKADVEFPIWAINNNGRADFSVNFHPSIGSIGNCLSQKILVIGGWNDFIIKADYATRAIDNYNYFEIWHNGKIISECSLNKPLITKEILNEGFRNNGIEGRKMFFKYGIYKFRLSEWFIMNKKKTPEFKTGKHKTDKLMEVVYYPFKYDWGIELPTTTVYYDEVRIGNTIKSVQINKNNPVD